MLPIIDQFIIVQIYHVQLQVRTRGNRKESEFRDEILERDSVKPH